MWVFLYFKPKIKMLIPSFENHRKISELILIQRSSIFFPYFESKGFYFGPLFIVILRAVCFLINNCLTRSKFLMFVQAGWEPFQKYPGHPSISPRPIIFHFSHKRKKITHRKVQKFEITKFGNSYFRGKSNWFSNQSMNRLPIGNTIILIENF